MILTLKNIGILKNAELDFSSDLIILCGPNNTGKTFAAYTSYAVYSNAYSESDSPLIHFETDIDPKAHENLKKNGSASINIWEVFLHNEKIFSFDYAREVNNNIYTVFDSTRDFFKNSAIQIKFNHSELETRLKTISFERVIKFGNFTIQFNKKSNTFLLDVSVVFEQPISSRSNLHVVIENLVPRFLTDLMMKSIFQRTYFSPAERIAINLFSKQLSVQRNKLVDNLLSYKENSNDTNGILSRTRLYPLPIRDALQIAERLVEYQKDSSDFSYISDWIEKQVLNGIVKLSREGEVQFKPKGSKIKPIGIHMSASMVKSLASLVFYFRHIARKGDFIIIDEPELNLHPDNQRKVAKLLARIVNAGFKVMISTHSDYIYRELNNLIMLNKDSETAVKLAKTHNYQKEELLDYKKIGAYLFLNSTCKRLPVTESGFEVQTIDEEIGSLNDASMEIFTSLF